MNTRSLLGIAVFLLLVIIVLLWALFAIPLPAHAPTVATTTPNATTSPTLSALAARVIVSSPASGASVPKTFTVSGEAPGPWYFEASFPIKIVDANNNFIGQGIAQAQSDWMVTGQVPFAAAVTVTGYSGPATMVLLRDNPSGMPENDDSISVSITIQ